MAMTPGKPVPEDVARNAIGALFGWLLAGIPYRYARKHQA